MSAAATAIRPRIGGTSVTGRVLNVRKQLVVLARGHPASFWLLTAYIFFEYVRPQTIYPWLDILPWATTLLALTTAASVIESSGRRRWQTLDTAMLIFSAVVLLSLVTAYSPAYGVENLGIFTNWLILYFVISSTLNAPNRLYFFLLTFFLWNLKMTSHAFRSWAGIGFAWRDLGTGGAPGWFQNSGEFGIQMCVIFPLSLYFALGARSRVGRLTFWALMILPISAVLGAIASSSRGALLGIAAVGLLALLRSKYKVRATVATLVLASAAYALVPPEQIARMSESGSDVTSVSRLTYWERGIDITNAHPLLGVGFFNWLPYYRDHYSGWIQLSHNIFIQCMSELGYMGLAAMVLLIIGTFVTNGRTRRAAKRLGAEGTLLHGVSLGLDGALVGFLVSGFFITVLYYPYLWVNLGLTAGLSIATRSALVAQGVAVTRGTQGASANGGVVRRRLVPTVS